MTWSEKGALRRLTIAAVAILPCAQMAARADHSLQRKSPVWDEQLHVDYGLNFLRLGPAVPPADHPYPAAALLAVPLALTPIEEPGQIDRRVPIAGAERKAELRVIEHPKNLFPARRANVAIAALGLLLLGWGLSRRLGAFGALVFVAIGAFDPGWIAQARFVTTDVIFGLAFFGAAVALDRHRQSKRWHGLVAAGLLCALAMSAKMSGVLLLPAAFLLFLVPDPAEAQGATLLERAAGGLKATAAVTAVAAVALILIFEAHAILGMTSWSAGPKHVWSGISAFVDNFSKPKGSYLLGSFYPEGTALYFPVLLAAKTPLALLAAAALAFTKAPRRLLLRPSAALLVIPALYLLVAVSSGVNIGHRHLTPVLPAIWLLGAAGLSHFARGSLSKLVAAAALGVLLVLEGLAAHPHYLPSTNLAFGGLDNAHELAVDSTTDWGQDLPALAAWMRSQGGGAQLHLAYFGTADPRRYGLKPVWRPCGMLGARPWPRAARAPCRAPAELLAVSATCLQGAVSWTERDECYEPLRGRAPDAIIGGSVLVYRQVPGEGAR